jgi:hypothetical protein
MVMNEEFIAKMNALDPSSVQEEPVGMVAVEEVARVAPIEDDINLEPIADPANSTPVVDIMQDKEDPSVPELEEQGDNDSDNEVVSDVEEENAPNNKNLRRSPQRELGMSSLKQTVVFSER